MAGILLLGAGVASALIVNRARLGVSYEGPATPVRPGTEVTIRAPDEVCGPLIVSLHEEGRFGLGRQTHSGSVIHGLGRDERPWWSPGSHSSPVPCLADGAATFTLPTDIDDGVTLACDMDRRCARITVDRRAGE